MTAKKNKGRCIGGPADGQEIESDFDRIEVPINPHTPSASERESFGESCPDVLFDVGLYRWGDGAWHYHTH